MNFPVEFKWYFLLAIVAIVVITPDVALWLIYTVFALLHALFELLEATLDEIVEHLLHTDRRTTQIIVFYLMWAIVLYPSYRVFRYSKNRFLALKEATPHWINDKKELAKVNWQQSPVTRHKIITGCFIGAVGFSYLVF